MRGLMFCSVSQNTCQSQLWFKQKHIFHRAKPSEPFFFVLLMPKCHLVLIKKKAARLTVTSCTLFWPFSVVLRAAYNSRFLLLSNIKGSRLITLLIGACQVGCVKFRCIARLDIFFTGHPLF